MHVRDGLIGVPPALSGSDTKDTERWYCVDSATYKPLRNVHSLLAACDICIKFGDLNRSN